jgi:hypothetical protein
MQTKEERVRTMRRLERLALIKQRHRKVVLASKEKAQPDLPVEVEAEVDFEFDFEIN